ncbi:MAG TPA: hypothetical protein VLW06_16075 [Terriglobales bacterium]|nr:hypothetical protein [Terriglobales bacterium]
MKATPAKEEERIARPPTSTEQLTAQMARASAALRKVLPENGGHSPDPPAAGRTRANQPPVNLSTLSDAFTEVMRTRKLIEHCKFETPELVTALAEYQILLRHFRSQLPRYYGWLLAERARLANRESHSAAVGNWLETNRQTR